MGITTIYTSDTYIEKKENSEELFSVKIYNFDLKLLNDLFNRNIANIRRTDIIMLYDFINFFGSIFVEAYFIEDNGNSAINEFTNFINFISLDVTLDNIDEKIKQYTNENSQLHQFIKSGYLFSHYNAEQRIELIKNRIRAYSYNKEYFDLLYLNVENLKTIFRIHNIYEGVEDSDEVIEFFNDLEDNKIENGTVNEITEDKSKYYALKDNFITNKKGAYSDFYPLSSVSKIVTKKAVKQFSDSYKNEIVITRFNNTTEHFLQISFEGIDKNGFIVMRLLNDFEIVKINTMYIKKFNLGSWS